MYLGDADAVGVFVDVADGDDAHAEEGEAEADAVEPAQAGGDLVVGFLGVGFEEGGYVCVLAVCC